MPRVWRIIVVICSIRKSNFAKDQNGGGRGRRKKEKEKDEEEDIPKEGKPKRRHHTQALQGTSWLICNRQCWILNQCLMGRPCTNSGKYDKEASHRVAFRVPACLGNALLPTNPYREGTAQQSTGWGLSLQPGVGQAHVLSDARNKGGKSRRLGILKRDQAWSLFIDSANMVECPPCASP